MKCLQDLQPRHNGIGGGNGGDDISGDSFGAVETLNGVDLKDVGAEVRRGGDKSHGEGIIFVEFGKGLCSFLGSHLCDFQKAGCEFEDAFGRGPNLRWLISLGLRGWDLCGIDACF